MTPAERQTLFAHASRLTAAGLTIEEACKAAGIGVATFYKWKARGLPAAEAKPATGRPAALVLDEAESAALRWHALRKSSGRLAVQDFLRDGRCRAETAEILLAAMNRADELRRPVSFPLCIRRILSVTPEEKNQFRGKRHTLRSEFVAHRGMNFVDEEGREFPLAPGDLYESDDMSVNQPFRFTDPASGAELLGRQCLLTQDVHALNFLGASPIGRPRDAYRVEDIADHMLAIVQAWGLPLFWRLERGPWENNFIDGLPLEDLGRPGQRWGGLGELFHVARAWSPNQKGGIEGSFRHLQRISAHPDNSADIGTYAGEFEHNAKAMMRAKHGREADLKKFWTAEQAAAALAADMERFNGELKQRDVLGGRFSPEELFAARTEKRDLKAEDAWRFLPVKRRATIRNGAVETTAPHWPRPFFFAVNGVAENLFLATGHQVLIAFHPGHPEQGCAVFNADMGPRNRAAWRFGQFLLTAPAQDLAPQIDLSGRGPRQKTQAIAAMRSEFRAVRAAGQTSAPSLSAVRDGLGDSIHMARGQSPVAEMPAPAGRLAAVEEEEPQEAPSRLGAASRLPAPVPNRSHRDAADSLAELDTIFS